MILKTYKFLKRLIPWKIKARIKSFFLDFFYYQRALFFYKISKLTSFPSGRNQVKQPPFFQNKKSKQIHILFVVPYLVFGGADRILFDVIKNLHGHGFAVTICCTQQKGELAPKFEKIVQVYDASKINRNLWHRKDFVISLTKELKCDIVHLSNNDVFYFIFPFLKIKTSVITVNWIHHDPMYFEKLHEWGYKRFSEVIDKTVVTTKLMKQFLVQKKHLPSNKVTVIPNGVDIILFNPRLFYKKIKLLKDKYSIPQNNQVVTFISRLTSEKNPLDFIKIAKEVSLRYPQSTFIIAGGGYFLNEMVSLSKKLHIYDRIRFLGFREEIPEILAISSVVVLTSTSEAFGLSAAEAMAMQVPVVASNVGGMKELIKDNKCSFLVNPQDVNEFSNKIVYLLHNPKIRKSIGEKARKHIEENFSVKGTVNSLAAFYRELIIDSN